jgi:hypothetical protein
VLSFSAIAEMLTDAVHRRLFVDGDVCALGGQQVGVPSSRRRLESLEPSEDGWLACGFSDVWAVRLANRLTVFLVTCAHIHGGRSPCPSQQSSN